MASKLLHYVAHLFSLNKGVVVAEWHGHHLWVGLKCDGCGYVFDAVQTEHYRRHVPKD